MGLPMGNAEMHTAAFSYRNATKQKGKETIYLARIQNRKMMPNMSKNVVPQNQRDQLTALSCEGNLPT